MFGVRVDSKLKTAFTKVAGHVFGSTCNPIESFMAAVVGMYQNPTLAGVNPSITIGEIKIERNLRERRKVETVTRETSTVYSRMDRNLANVKDAGKILAPEKRCEVCHTTINVNRWVTVEGRRLLCSYCAKELTKSGKILPGRPR